MLVGGGRWAKVWFRILSALRPQPRIHWVSSRNRAGLEQWLAAHDPSADVHLYFSLDELFQAVRPDVAIVANLPDEHAETVRKLLVHNCHVLVEKPFVPTAEEARALSEIAASKGRVLAVDLELMAASYVEAFNDTLASRPAEITSAEVVWHDRYDDVRSALPKTPDLTTNVVTDLLPHVLSLLTVLFGVAEIATEEITVLVAGLTANLKVRYGNLPVNISLSRDAQRPSRTIRLGSPKGWHVLDFTNEPGEIVTPSGEHIPDRRWESVPKPLNRVLSSFLDAVAAGHGTLPPLAERTHHIVRAGDAVAKVMVRVQTDEFRPFLLDSAEADLPFHALVALREHLAGPLLAEGLVTNPKDETSLNHWSRTAWRVIHRFACHPFTTQRDMAAVLGLEPRVMRKLNEALRRSALAQDLMVSRGTAMKYWENTILPLMEAGVVDAARRAEPRHPFRVGVYPGVSCMFFCSFCGRNRDAKYAGADVPPGNDMFEALFRDAPADPYTFYLSGGLEPLTNPGIGKLVTSGSQRGFKLSMYTNGYMLTPQLLARQTGLWDLDTLRISMYGVNAESATAVTSNPKAFAQVVQNATAFLAARNERGSPLKFGFNFVVLPGRVEEVLALVELIASINRAAGGGRHIDFLTLREDYSVPADQGLAQGERQRLAQIFDRLRDRANDADLRGLTVDFGYALHPLSLGASPTPLEMVDAGAMRRAGYPQISVVVDLLGDVYLYREAGFLDRPGANRYIIGRVTPARSLRDVVEEFVTAGRTIEPRPGDTGFFDIFDHVVTHLLNQADEDEAFGIPFERGPIRDRGRAAAGDHPTLAHPTLAHPTLTRL